MKATSSAANLLLGLAEKIAGSLQRGHGWTASQIDLTTEFAEAKVTQ